jgi:hypothetical protein
MLRDLIRAPADYERWFERYAARLILQLAFDPYRDQGFCRSDSRCGTYR